MPEVQQGSPVVVMHEQDDVATALRALKPGEQVTIRVGDDVTIVTVADAIPFGHKLAIRAVAAGEPVRKYGEVIGRAAQSILPGQHVHVHNLESARGRGDLLGNGSTGSSGRGSD